jgi:hypothetical protein
MRQGSSSEVLTAAGSGVGAVKAGAGATRSVAQGLALTAWSPPRCYTVIPPGRAGVCCLLGAPWGRTGAGRRAQRKPCRYARRGVTALARRVRRTRGLPARLEPMSPARSVPGRATHRSAVLPIVLRDCRPGMASTVQRGPRDDHCRNTFLQPYRQALRAFPAPLPPGGSSRRGDPWCAPPSAAAGLRTGCQVGALGAAPDPNARGCGTRAFSLGVPPASWTPTLPFHTTSPKVPAQRMKLPACPCKDRCSFL